MKTNHYPANTAHESFGVISIACFLILVAWGNAIAMLVFSLIGLAIWFMLPETRGGGESSTHHHVLVKQCNKNHPFIVSWYDQEERTLRYRFDSIGSFIAFFVSGTLAITMTVITLSN